MSANGRIPRFARQYLEKGFRPVPVNPATKAPIPPGWQDLVPDAAFVERAFGNGAGYNLGVVCGLQPNDLMLLAVDVDPGHGGDVTWAALIEGWGGVPAGPVHRTPSGGFHLFFNVPIEACRTGRNTLGPGVDTRGVGGQVVVPPSRFVDVATGEVRPYLDDPSSSLLTVPVPDAPAAMVQALLATVLPEAVRTPVSPGASSPFDLLRESWDWIAELVADGWSVSHQRGDQVFMTRPGKLSRDGHSAVIHLDTGHLVIWSSNAPLELSLPLRPSQVNRDGSLSWSPGDYLTATRFDRDASAAASWVRRRLLPPPVGVTDTLLATTPQVPFSLTGSSLFLPSEWYDQRPWMAACRQMAEAVGGSPSAHLLAFLCRWATLIPPGYSIPPINGALSSFDLLCVIAGTSGSGKTSPMHNAEDLLPVTRADLRMGLGLGSGEGIIEAFYGMAELEDDKGKKRKERRKLIAGVNFAISEGLIFAELAGRGGTTHVTRLCDAWSGASLSTANASAETFRHIERGQYRLTLMMAIQADMAHQLMNDSAAAQGFVGRLLFCWAEEPRVSPRPGPPGLVTLPVPPKIATPSTRDLPEQFTRTFLDYPSEVYAEIQGASDARVGTQVPVEEHHHDLLRCKLAGIVALMDGRLVVTLEDWGIATDLASTSRAVRTHLYETRRLAQRDLRHASAEARGEADFVAETAKERRAITDYKAKVLARLRAEGPLPYGTDGGLGKLTSSKRRWMVERAVTELEDEGAIRKVGDRYQLA